MKTFLRKLKLSFLAMLCGWVACNIAWWLAYLPEPRKHTTAQELLEMMLVLGIYMLIVILAAWLVIFLPVDLLVPDQSKLRKPWVACICGFLAGMSPVWIYLLRSHPSAADCEAFFTWKPFLTICSPGITGMVAALMRSSGREPSVLKP